MPEILTEIGHRGRQPYPLDEREQQLLFSELPPHAAEMATFVVNTGVRDRELCQLKWSWERRVSTPDCGARLAECLRVAARGREERRVARDRSQRCCASHPRASSWSPSPVRLRVAASAHATGPPTFGRLARGPQASRGAVPRVVRDGSAGWLPNRPGTAEDQAGEVSFVASDDAAFITGQTILADGGQGRT